MKRDLLLLRHAKSDWSSGTREDHDRPLNERGVSAAGRVGKWLAGAVPDLDLVVSSTALRAAETARLVRGRGLEAPLRLDRRLYETDVDSMLELVRSLEDDHTSVLLVGHQPTWSALVATLIGGGAIVMPTAAVAGVRFELGSWREVGPGKGELRFLITPKLLGLLAEAGLAK